jgi:hypothetical protein
MIRPRREFDFTPHGFHKHISPILCKVKFCKVGMVEDDGLGAALEFIPFPGVCRDDVHYGLGDPVLEAQAHACEGMA